MSLMLLIIIGGLLSVVYGAFTIKQLMAADAGNARMQEIAQAIAEGAQAYLRRQYLTISYVGVALFVIIGFLLGVAVTYTVVTTRARDAALRKLNSVD